MIPPSTWGWYAYSVYELAQRHGHTIHDRRAFEDAIAVDAQRRLTDLAEAWWGWWVLTPQRLAQCLVDLNAPRYAERRSR